MRILKATEQALETALAVLVYHNSLNQAGTLKALRVFRGSGEQARRHFDDPGPCALLLRGKWGREGDYGIAMQWQLLLKHDTERSEGAAYSGSGVSGESVGLDEIAERVFGLLDHRPLAIGTLPMTLPEVVVTGGGVAVDEATGSYSEVLELSVRLPQFENLL